MGRMRWLMLSLVVAVTLGTAGLLGRWTAPRDRTVSPPPTTGTALPASTPPDSPTRVGAATTDLEALAGALEEERKARRALAKEVASLRAELAKLTGGSNAHASEPQASPGDAHEHPFDEQALRDAGFGEREA